MKKYAVYGNCIKLSNYFDTHKEAYDHLVKKLREYEEKKADITYGINSFSANGFIYEIVEEDEE